MRFWMLYWDMRRSGPALRTRPNILLHCKSIYHGFRNLWRELSQHSRHTLTLCSISKAYTRRAGTAVWSPSNILLHWKTYLMAPKTYVESWRSVGNKSQHYAPLKKHMPWHNELMKFKRHILNLAFCFRKTILFSDIKMMLILFKCVF